MKSILQKFLSLFRLPPSKYWSSITTSEVTIEPEKVEQLVQQPNGQRIGDPKKFERAKKQHGQENHKA